MNRNARLMMSAAAAIVFYLFGLITLICGLCTPPVSEYSTWGQSILLEGGAVLRCGCFVLCAAGLVCGTLFAVETLHCLDHMDHLHHKGPHHDRPHPHHHPEPAGKKSVQPMEKPQAAESVPSSIPPMPKDENESFDGNASEDVNKDRLSPLQPQQEEAAVQETSFFEEPNPVLESIAAEEKKNPDTVQEPKEELDIQESVQEDKSIEE